MAATGWLVQAATLLEITTRLADNIGHGFCDCLSAMGLVGHFTLEITELSCNPSLHGSLHPYMYMCLWC